jgi:hypothetical protein
MRLKAGAEYFNTVGRDLRTVADSNRIISPFKYCSFFKWICGAIIVMLYLGVLVSNLGDPDLWGYLAFGRLFWNQPSFPYQDIFSYMPVKNPWIYHEWLTGVLFYPIYSESGSVGLQGLRYVLAFAALFFAGWVSRIRGASIEAVCLCLFVAVYVFAFGYSPVRAQIFTYLFFAITLFLLESSRVRKMWRRLGWLIPVQIMWCNLHGGFVAGLGLIMLYFVGESLSGRRFLPYLAALIPSFLVTLINPYGLDYWIYTLDAVTMPRPEITEWLNVYAGIQQELFISSILSFFILVFFSILLFALYHQRDITAGLVLAVTAYLGLTHVRHIVFFALAFIVFIPLPFTLLWGQLEEKLKEAGRLKFTAVLIGVVVALVIIDSSYTFYREFICGAPFSIQTTSKGKSGKTEHYFPSGAVNYIQSSGLRGNILPFFDWGEYLIWNLYPACKVGMDGRYETVYPDKVHKAYFDFIYGREGWREFLNGYSHDMILVRAGTRIHGLLRRERNWIEAYRGQGTSLFLKKSSYFK